MSVMNNYLQSNVSTTGINLGTSMSNYMFVKVIRRNTIKASQKQPVSKLYEERKGN